ncbi:MAG: hypothetical protein IKT22_06370 [Prevotella sp.]|nr:hypothetical protein [Prevotella sp.]
MTALQQGTLNAEILRNLGTLADNEDMLTRVAKYLRKLVGELQHDPTLMSREEFFARIDRASKGPLYELGPNESLDDLIKRAV